MAATGSRTIQAHLSKPDVSSFPEHLYLISLMYPQGTGATGWLWGVFWVSQGLGEMNVRRAEEAGMAEGSV